MTNVKLGMGDLVVYNVNAEIKNLYRHVGVVVAGESLFQADTGRCLVWFALKGFAQKDLVLVDKKYLRVFAHIDETGVDTPQFQKETRNLLKARTSYWINK